ncbi:MAG: dockerin type I domain-containing protein [Clostridiales bacterium]|nr:dockerin type I domain-containing protein [Clostridiales bacterium]
MKLKCILGVLTAFAAASIFSVCAYAGTMSVGSVTGSAGSTVDVSVSISPEGDSETLNAFAFNLTYDSDVLTHVSIGELDATELDYLYATAADSISSGVGVFVAAPTSEDGTLAVAWAADTAITYSEETLLFTVSFEIAEGASAGDSSLSLAATQITADGTTLDDVSAYTAAGTVTVSDSSFIRGDANGDSNVDIKDAALISDHVNSLDTINDAYLKQADANADNSVEIKDAALISDYVNDLEEIS